MAPLVVLFWAGVEEEAGVNVAVAGVVEVEGFEWAGIGGGAMRPREVEEDARWSGGREDGRDSKGREDLRSDANPARPGSGVREAARDERSMLALNFGFDAAGVGVGAVLLVEDGGGAAENLCASGVAVKSGVVSIGSGSSRSGITAGWGLNIGGRLKP